MLCRKYIFIKGPFSIATLVYPSVMVFLTRFPLIKKHHQDLIPSTLWLWDMLPRIYCPKDLNQWTNSLDVFWRTAVWSTLSPNLFAYERFDTLSPRSLTKKQTLSGKNTSAVGWHKTELVCFLKVSGEGLQVHHLNFYRYQAFLETFDLWLIWIYLIYNVLPNLW